MLKHVEKLGKNHSSKGMLSSVTMQDLTNIAKEMRFFARLDMNCRHDLYELYLSIFVKHGMI